MFVGDLRYNYRQNIIKGRGTEKPHLEAHWDHPEFLVSGAISMADLKPVAFSLVGPLVKKKSKPDDSHHR